MAKILVLVVILGVIGGLFWLMRKPAKSRGVAVPSRPKQVSSRQSELDRMRESKQFWGVEIRQTGCPVAKAHEGKQYTLEEAPHLPLEGCTAPHCSCVYLGLKEHRVRQRRVSHDRREVLRFEDEKPDRRSHKDRRKSNKAWEDRDF
jgi:hypothetical protein